MSLPMHIAGSAVLFRENSNAPMVLSSVLAVAWLCTAFLHRSGRRLTPPAGERPGRDHRSLGPSAGSSLLLRARPCLQAGGRARVCAYLQELPLHVGSLRPWSQVTTDGFAHVQKVFAEIANVER